MPLRPLTNHQTWLLPPTLDDLIPATHPARFVASYVESLDRRTWAQLGIGAGGEWLGAPAYHPQLLLSVWLYGFMTGTRSSRKLENECRDSMAYLYLTGWQHPDHNTLWRFYKEHRGAMRHVFKSTVRTAVKMGLVDMAVQAVDGSKVVANAARERTHGREEMKRLLERAEAAIADLEAQNEKGDDPAPVYLPEELTRAEVLRDRVKQAMAELEKEKEKQKGETRVNLTDGDADLMKTRQGIQPGYNVQTVVSPVRVEGESAGMLITAVEAVQDKNDVEQLASMMDLAKETTGSAARATLGDAGYHSGPAVAACEERRQRIVMPETQDKALENPYHKDNFLYEEETDRYLCPAGAWLHFIRNKKTGETPVRVYGGSRVTCHNCPQFGTCTRNWERGRTIEIGPYDGALRRHREWMKTEEAQKLGRLRKQMSEPVFGILKEQLGLRRFLLRGLENVRAEATTVALAYNLRVLWAAWWRQTCQGSQAPVALKHALESVLEPTPASRECGRGETLAAGRPWPTLSPPVSMAASRFS